MGVRGKKRERRGEGGGGILRIVRENGRKERGRSGGEEKG